VCACVFVFYKYFALVLAFIVDSKERISLYRENLFFPYCAYDNKRFDFIQ